MAADTPLHSTMVNQYVLQGIGNLDEEQWRIAIADAASANPGIHLQLKGFWGKRYWAKDGKTPKLHQVKHGWSGLSNDNAFFDKKAIDCRKDPCAEVYLIDSHQPKVVFRVHHAIADGNATLFWIQDVFRALRGERLLGSEGRKNEWELFKDYKRPDHVLENHSWIPVNSSSNSEEVGNCHWLSFKIKEEIQQALPKTINIINKVARENSASNAEPHVSFRIPSNLRRLLDQNEKFHLGNMVGAYDLEVSPEQSSSDIYKTILKDIHRKKDLSIFPNALGIANWLPKKTFTPSPNYFKKLHNSGFCNITGIVTHVGEVNLSDLSYKDFKTERIYPIPVPLEGVSISVCLLADNTGLNCCISMPTAYGNKDILKEMELRICKELVSE